MAAARHIVVLDELERRLVSRILPLFFELFKDLGVPSLLSSFFGTVGLLVRAGSLLGLSIGNWLRWLVRSVLFHQLLGSLPCKGLLLLDHVLLLSRLQHLDGRLAHRAVWVLLLWTVEVQIDDLRHHSRCGLLFRLLRWVILLDGLVVDNLASVDRLVQVLLHRLHILERAVLDGSIKGDSLLAADVNRFHSFPWFLGDTCIGLSPSVVLNFAETIEVVLGLQGEGVCDIFGVLNDAIADFNWLHVYDLRLVFDLRLRLLGHWSLGNGFGF